MSNWIDSIFDIKLRLTHRDVITRLSQVSTNAADRLFAWQERSKQRRDLSRLDGRMLKDIGVDSSKAWRETQKPFWRR
jgi:uncharacterized protein YjiS (DUF1127 family)